MEQKDIKRLLMKMGPLVLAGLTFAIQMVSDRLSKMDQKEYLREEVEKEVRRQLGTPDQTEESDEGKETEEE